jgi:hypothetical protein
MTPSPHGGATSSPRLDPQPAIKAGRPPLTPTARLHPNSACNALYHLTRTNRLVHDKTRQAHAAPNAITPAWTIPDAGFLHHARSMIFGEESR